MNPVRLWRWGDQWRESPISDSMPRPVAEEVYIALPAAEHAALVALLGECRRAVRHARQDCAMLEDQIAWYAVAARLDAALAGQEGGAK